MNGGSLVTDTWYPIKAFMTENTGKDYIRITYNADGGSDATNWAGMLQNLKSGEKGNVLQIFIFLHADKIYNKCYSCFTFQLQLYDTTGTILREAK